ncbi:DUF4469 domain-containing protein [Aliifodinibius sp. S!AR15-10]|uniref:DNA-binding domain-containing protein n=1 Tax=Aliifodinibius sp. S!AR15-10 TaxID=2950437 RepID=UPI00285A8D6C|nr:DNA-binding domain-containing protein [Aliifodinibius sp. S!AR15-10]MDR8394299.1 DUF4469 domain-containing protein [Aliifodinibius sp. S!AR15-10]
MSISYSIQENHLTDNPNDYVARVQDQLSRDIEDIVDIMTGRGSTVTKAEAFSVLEEFEAAVVKTLQQGHSVNTPLFRINASISGTFDAPSDSFDPQRHNVKMNVNPGIRIKNIAEDVTVEKIAADRREPVLRRYHDGGSGTTNETLSPSHTGRLVGELLKIDPGDQEQGVFLIGPDEAETRVNEYNHNMPSKLGFRVPEGLESGEYTMEVRAKLHNTNELRVGTLNASLTVT